MTANPDPMSDAPHPNRPAGECTPRNSEASVSDGGPFDSAAGSSLHDDWLPPRCEHGHIILGRPDDTCAAQGAYLADQRAAMDAYDRTLQDNARRIVHELLGLPT